MSDEIIKVLDNLAERFGVAIDWTSENVMPYLQDLMSRYMSYNIGISIMWLIIDVIMVIISIFIGYKCIKTLMKYDISDDGDAYCFFSILGTAVLVVIIIISAVNIPSNIEKIIKAKTVPEMVMYDYVKTLM